MATTAASSGGAGGHRPPIAKVLTVLQGGQTARDTAEDIAEDIALLRHAMQNIRQVQDALKEVEDTVGPNASVTEIADAVKSDTPP
jgi:hypothetical protein